MYGYKVLRKFAIVIAATLLASMSPVAEAAKTSRAKSIAGREDAVKNTILNGRGAPKPSLGIDGDFYIDVTTFTIYGPKKGSKWPAGFNLRGPQGEDGKSGERGAAGASGTGSKGEKGERGEKGEKGDKGEAGAVGATGPAGMQGATGAQGPAGPAGVAGATGATGATGSQGPQGLKGDTGDQGPQGVKGDTGDQGEQGVKGDLGPSNVFVGAISFSESLVGSIGQMIESETFGTLAARQSYQVDLTLYGSGVQETLVLPLSFAVVADGAPLAISHVQWVNSSNSSYRSGQAVQEHTVWARFAINGSSTSEPYSLRVRLTAGDMIIAGRDVTFQGNYRIQLVGAVTQ